MSISHFYKMETGHQLKIHLVHWLADIYHGFKSNKMKRNNKNLLKLIK